MRPRAASDHAQNQPHGGQNIERNVFDLVPDREALPTEAPAICGKIILSSLTEPPDRTDGEEAIASIWPDVVTLMRQDSEAQISRP